MESGKALGLGAAVAAAGIAAWLAYSRPAPPPASLPPPPPAPQAPAQPTGLPGLDASDDLARSQARALFPGAKLEEWLLAEGLLRRVTAATRIAAEGGSPRESLAFLQPTRPFKAVRKGGVLVVDPQSYRRYDAAADAFAALDAAGAAKAIRLLSPLFDQACDELAPGCTMRASLQRAIKELLKTPVVAGDIRLRRKVVSYVMTDKALESLSPAQKHLLRMGPRNVEKIQAKLRELAAALEGA